MPNTTVTPDRATGQQLFECFKRVRKVPWMHLHHLGLKPSAMHALFCIGGEKRHSARGVTVSEISQRLHVTSPTVTQLIKELEGGGYIERTVDETDRRLTLLHLTGRGEDIVERGRKAIGDAFAGLAAYLGEADSRTLVRLLTKVADYHAALEQGAQMQGGNET